MLYLITTNNNSVYNQLIPDKSESKMTEDTSKIMTIEEVAEFLRIPQSSVYKLAQQGKIPCSKIGRHWRFRRETIERWFDESSTLHQPSIQGKPQLHP